MKIGDEIQRFGRSVEKNILLRLLCGGLETWYNCFIRGTGGRIVHAFPGNMTFAPKDRVRLVANVHRRRQLLGFRLRNWRTEEGQDSAEFRDLESH